MSIFGRIKNKLDEVIGGFKESVGEATGNKALEIDGEAEHDAAVEREAREEAVEREAREEAVERGAAEGEAGTQRRDDDGTGGVPAGAR